MKEIQIRLQKYLSECGVCSRRAAEEWIRDGRVKVNGSTASLGDKVDPRRDIVTVNGKRIERTQENKRYILLHKPRGFVTTMQDEMGRKCVAELVRNVGERVYPVGRLDRNSEGMLLMTNDGAFANYMTHPKNHVPKIYRVTIKQKMPEDLIQRFAEGVVLEDGTLTLPAEAVVVTAEPDRTVLRVTLYEGKNRQIRRMFEAMGCEVARLKRIAIGELRLGMLPQGKWRDLTEQEVRSLYSEAKRMSYLSGNSKESYRGQNYKGRKKA